jgi:hypothetical protein
MLTIFVRGEKLSMRCLTPTLRVFRTYRSMASMAMRSIRSVTWRKSCWPFSNKIMFLDWKSKFDTHDSLSHLRTKLLTIPTIKSTHDILRDIHRIWIEWSWQKEVQRWLMKCIESIVVFISIWIEIESAGRSISYVIAWYWVVLNNETENSVYLSSASSVFDNDRTKGYPKRTV